MKLSPKEILKPALALLLICVAATALLALTNSVTAARAHRCAYLPSPFRAQACSTH